MEKTIKETTRLLTQGIITRDEADKILLGLFSVRQHIFVIKDTAGDWVKLFTNKEDADKECDIFAKQHDYVGFYVDEEKLN